MVSSGSGYRAGHERVVTERLPTVRLIACVELIARDIDGAADSCMGGRSSWTTRSRPLDADTHAQKQQSSSNL